MNDEQQSRRRFFSFRPRIFALTCVAIYLAAAVLSLVIAHIILIVWPQSGWAERVIAPVSRGIEFLDTHWKAVLILVAPFAVPVVRGLVPRLRKIGPVELDRVQLEPTEVREKPSQNTSGEMK